MKKKYMARKQQNQNEISQKNNQGQHLLTAFPSDNTTDCEQQNEECE